MSDSLDIPNATTTLFVPGGRSYVMAPIMPPEALKDLGIVNEVSSSLMQSPKDQHSWYRR
jgi:hypothetical protein